MSRAIPLYCYRDLLPGPNSIRLLRLLPSEDENAVIQCQLFNCSLQESGKRTHPYDALSYVWGESDKTRHICVDLLDLSINPNLHDALTHLRHPYIERIIWVDAVCINQANEAEKERQILFMAKIYGQATRVVVWLGEAAEKSDQALEEIRVAGGKISKNSLKKEAIEKAILALLRRPWFQRIWVLQEVAAARHILIACGSTEIDGYTFCLGVESLRGFFDTRADLQSLIRSVTYLIRGAIFRPKGSGRVSQDICPPGELIDMYHTYQATLRHDKVYALLGMSSDDLSKANLSPDYKVPWKDLFEILTRFLLCKEISVEASPDKEIAVIKSKGYILGKVSSIQSDLSWNSGQGVDVISRNISGTSEYTKEEWDSYWTLQSSAKSIRIGDVICLLQGTSKLIIIRFCDDHWAIILIAATSPQTIRTGSEDVEWSKFLHLAKLRTRDLQLVWDWENSPGKLQGLGEYEESEGYLDKVIRLWNFALVLGDAGLYKKAEETFREAMEGYETAFGKGRLHDTEAHLLSLGNSADLDLMNSQYGRPPLSWAAEKGYEAVLKLLLETCEADVNIQDMDGRTPLLWAAKGGHLAIVERLLQEKAEINAAAAAFGGRTALQTAAEGGHLAVVKRLLQEKAEVNAAAGFSGRTALQTAAEGGHLAVVERLLQEKAEVNAAAAEQIGRTALQAAAEGGHLAVVERLLQEKAEVNPVAAGFGGMTALQAAAGRGHLAIVERLLQEKAEVNPVARFGRGTALQAAADGGHLVVVERLRQAGAAK